MNLSGFRAIPVRVLELQFVRVSLSARSIGPMAPSKPMLCILALLPLPESSRHHRPRFRLIPVGIKAAFRCHTHIPHHLRHRRARRRSSREQLGKGLPVHSSLRTAVARRVGSLPDSPSAKQPASFALASRTPRHRPPRLATGIVLLDPPRVALFRSFDSYSLLALAAARRCRSSLSLIAVALARCCRSSRPRVAGCCASHSARQRSSAATTSSGFVAP